jgi:hypothetical protein
MAGDKVNRIVDPGDPASALNLRHALFEKTLATPRADDCFLVRFPDGRIGSNSLLKLVFPDIQVVAGHDSLVRGTRPWTNSA